MSTPSFDCSFCRIASGVDRSSEIVAEGRDWVAFFPAAPAAAGHTLIIPRDHVADFWSVDANLACELVCVAQRLGRAIATAIESEGMNLITSGGSAAEQTIFHLHLHLLPRARGDGIAIWGDAEDGLDPAQIRHVAALIRRQYDERPTC